MKKLIALLLCFVMLLSFCACGSGDSSDGSDANTNSNADADNTKQGGFVGSWTHAKTDAEPFTMNITLKADGTGTNGKSSGVKWTLDEANQQITIIIIYPDGEESEPSVAKLTADNKLCWEFEFKVQTADGTMLEYDKIYFNRD